MKTELVIEKAESRIWGRVNFNDDSINDQEDNPYANLHNKKDYWIFQTPIVLFELLAIKIFVSLYV